MGSLRDKSLLLLGILASESMHGYQLNKMLKDPHVSIRVGKANAYKILAGFEEKGWVTQSEEVQDKKPSRFVYSITDQGREKFRSLLLERLAESEPTEYPDGVALDFAGLLEPQEALFALRKRREYLAGRCESMRGISDDIRTSHPGLNFRVLQAELEYEILEKLIKKLETRIRKKS